jgi:uncharacterized repeat protein (TIGR01451 family)
MFLGNFRRGRRSASFAAVTVVMLGLIGTIAVTSPAVADEDDPLAQVTVDLSKTVSKPIVAPGETITYTIYANCASFEADCVNLAIDDTIPEPFVLGDVALSTGVGSVPTELTIDPEDPNHFTVAFVDELGEGLVGLNAGTLYNFAVTATLPLDVSADYDQDIVRNTAYATLSNVNSNKDAYVDVTLTVPTTVATTVGKSFADTDLPSVPGFSTGFELEGTNSSNTSVDSLVIEDATTDAFAYLAVSGVSVDQWPTGADLVQTDWFDGADWQPGSPAADIVLPADPALIQGLRFTFTSSSGDIARNSEALLSVDLALRDNVLGITGSALVSNTATSWATKGEESSAPVGASDSLTITKSEVSPVATKAFSTSSVVGGRPVTVTLGASNGGRFVLESMTITEPAPSTPTLQEQGLTFEGFVADDIEWPIGADEASIGYLYEGEADFAAPLTTTTQDELPPAEEGLVVVGFRVTFTGTMLEGQYAVVPFTATTAAVVADVTTTNTVRVDVETTGGLTASTLADDDLTSRTARINTSVRKVATPTTVYSVPGASAVFSLPGQIDPLPASPEDTGGSTVGGSSLVITDVDAQFWDYFDLTKILPTAVSAGVTLNVDYWDGTIWKPFTTNSSAVGPTSFSRSLSDEERAEVAGIRFVFTPTSGTDELPPGFAVQPNLRVALRADLRSDPGVPAANPDALEIITIGNTALTTATSPSATPSVVENTAAASLDLLPVPSGPGGIDLLEKHWVEETVNARTGDEATVRLDWGTGNLDFDSVTISDTADETALVSGTVYEAFDLVEILPITADMDPLLTYDRVTRVQLYIAGEWVDVVNNPCADADDCDGQFPGYELTPDESAAATGVRLVFEESPTREERIDDDPSAPPVGSGVASSFGLDREIDLVFAIRDDRRSNTSVPVLGSSRGALYNAGPADYGVVINSAGFRGVAPDDSVRTATDADDILILDQPLTVEATKTWTGGPLGMPPEDTPEQLYPTARMTLTAENTSLARVDSLSLLEPSPSLPVNPFEFVTITDVIDISVPSGPTATVYLQPSGDDYTVDEVEAMTRAELADVTGIEVVLEGSVASEDQIRVVLDTQLRATERTSGAAIDEAFQLDNEVQATIVDPGGSQIPDPGPNNVIIDLAQAHVDVEVFDYGILATKTIIADTTATDSVPATQYTSTERATVRLTGQPTGNVRTTRMVFEDTDASFWNAYDFAGFPSLSFATPINRVQVDVLVGVTYVVGPDNSISISCPTSDCWVTGTPSTTPQLPAGVDAEDVRGIRMTFTRSDYAAWERPFNPKQTVDFTVERREYLVEPADQLVPSTLFTFTEKAPGEDVIGVFNNDANVEVNSALNAEDTAPLWHRDADVDSAITVQHLPARVEISKSQYGPQSLGVDIPFALTITNTGGVHDSPLTGVVVVDQLPQDGSGAQLVIPTNPDTGQIYAANEAFSYSLLNSSGVAQSAPSVTAVYDNATNPTEITFTLNQTLPLGWSLVITAPLQFRALFGAGIEAVNTVTVDADQPFDDCRGTTDTVWGSLQQFVEDCTATTTVWPLPSSPMTIVKSVRGVEAGPLDAAGEKLVDPETDEPYDDLGVLRTTGTVSCEEPNTVVPGRTQLFYRYPCVPITRPGAEEEWASRFYNSGNISIKQIVAIDILPAPGDTGVIINELRSSKWKAALTTYPEVTGVPVGTTYTVYYTDETNVATAVCNGADIQLTMGMTTETDPPILNTPQYRNCLNEDGNGLATPRDWKVLDPDADDATLASVVALKFDVRLPEALAPDASVGILYRTVTANQQDIKETNSANLYRDSVAYNSIAGAAVGINTDSEGNPLDIAYRFVTEPRKVGVALATGRIDLAKDVTGPAASYATGTFDLTLTCLSNDEPVELTLFDGSSRNPFAVGANGTVSVYGVPLYSECSVAEAHDYGATTVTGPATAVSVLAQPNSGSSTVFDPHPAFDERPEVLTAAIDNYYGEASLTLTKTVATNGAVDQDGTAITYKPALASVTCTFDNGTGASTILSETGVQLVPGTPVVYDNLPAGALCTVVETNQRGAQTTSVVTTGAGTVEGGASPAQFALTEGSNGVAFANDFGVGSLRLTKTVAGLASAEAWAAGPFTVQVTCTNSNATASTVYSKSFTLTRTDNERLIENLPTGSVCVITEPQTNGATSVTLPSNVTINRAEQAATVTNTFSYARLTVSKTVSTNGVDGSGTATRPGPFDFSVTCTFTHGSTTDTVRATGFSSSPMTFSLSHGGSQALTGMPAGTTCTVTESTPVGSPTTSIRTTTGSSGPTTTSGLTANIGPLTADTNPTTGTNTAVVTNTYPVGTLRVTKSLQGGASTQFGTGPYTYLVTCTQPGITATYSKTVSVTSGGGWTTTVPNILAGSVCSVSETNYATSGADAMVILNNSGVAFDGTGVTIVGSSTRTVTFQNWYLTGAITVSKSVTGPGAAFGTGPFSVHLECTRGGQAITIAGGATRSLVDGGSTQYTLLPSGATCVLTESVDGSAGSTTITDSNGTHDVDGEYTFEVEVSAASLTDNQAQPAVTVTNNFELASLTVSKSVDSDAEHEDGSLVTYGDFAMQVTCLFNGGSVKATGFVSNTMTFTLADTESRTLSGLPAGAVCTITETDDQGAARTSVTTVSGGGEPSVTDGATASVTLVADATNSAAVLNEFDSGTVTLSKVVDGLAREEYGTGTFTVTIECTLPSTNEVVWTGTHTFVDGSPALVLGPIASNAECDIAETDTAGATSTAVTVGATSTPGTSATAIVPAGDIAVTLTNTFDYAGLVVSKEVVSEATDENDQPVYPGGSFDVEVSCEFLGEPVWAIEFESSPMAFSLGHLGEQPLTGLPAGTTCDITEVTTVEADSTSITTTTASTSATVDATTATIAYLTSDDDGEATNTADIVNRYGVTSFTVEKVLEGGASEMFGTGPFEIHVVCTAPGDVPAWDDTVSLPDGEDWFVRIDALPVGSVCTTDETNFATTGADAQRTLDADGNAVTSTTVTLDEPGYVAIHNWYLTGALEVTKRVTGDAGEFATAQFELTLECVVGDVDVFPGGVVKSLGDGQTVTFTGLPSGADCTLTESDVAGATSSSIELLSDGQVLAGDAEVGYTFTVVVDPEELVDDQPQPALRVSNEFPPASLVITKSVETLAKDENGTTIDYGPFPVIVTCEFVGEDVYATGYDADNLMTANLENAVPWTLEGLPAGAECQILEDDALGAVETSVEITVGSDTTISAGTEASIVLAPGATNSALIVNEFAVGSITLSKDVVGPGDEAWGTETFEVEVECILTDDSGMRPVYAGSYEFTNGDEPITIGGIAAGATCTVTEVATGAANSTTVTVGDAEPTPGTSAEFTLPAEDIAVVVTNTFEVTSIEITKERTGEGWEAWGAGPFEVTLICERDVDGDDQTIEIPGGATRKLEAPDYTTSYEGLPVGADCAMAENKVGGANGSSISPQAFELASVPTDVTVSNIFNLGDLTVTKKVTGDGVGVELWGSGPFEVSLECTRVVNGETVVVEVPGGALRDLDTDNSYIAQYTDLPEGAACVVTETVTGEATSTVVDPGVIAIVGNDTVNVDVTNTFTIGQLQIVKTASQPVVQAEDEFLYTFEVTNTGTVPAAGVTVVDEIPALLTVLSVDSDDWTDCAVADTDTYGYGGVLTCVYDETLAAGEKATPFTITVGVHPDIEVDQIDNVAAVTSTTRGVKGDDDDERVLVKWLDVTVASECVKDAPWFQYSVDAHNVDTSGKTMTVTWRDGTGAIIHEDEVPLDGGPISGALLWPGAAVNADGVGIAWPGWRAVKPGETPQFENLILDPTLADYGLRTDTRVTLSINPSTTVEIVYPEETADCVVERQPGLWVTKAASTSLIAAGGTFDYTIEVGNDGLGAVQDVVLVDEVPASLKVLSVTPAVPESADVPSWAECEITDRLPNGFGGTVTCVLDRALGYLEPVPAVVLNVQVDPSVPASGIVNVAQVTGLSTDGLVTLDAEDNAVVMTPGMLALTGLVVGGIAVPVAIGLLIAGLVLVVVRRQSRPARKH